MVPMKYNLSSDRIWLIGPCVILRNVVMPGQARPGYKLEHAYIDSPLLCFNFLI